MSFDRVIVITGAAKGIGAAIAKQVADKSTAIVVNYKASAAAADALIEELKQLGAGDAVAIQADVSTPDGAKKLIDETVARFGKITGLVNNAAIYEPAPVTAAPETIERTIAANVLSFLYVTSVAVPHIPDEGSIVNISSAITRTPFPNHTTYTASKGAMDAYTRALAVELGPRKIRVNAVLPGLTKTDMMPPGQEERAAQVTPFGEVGKPEQVAAAVAFLLDHKSRWVSGQSIGASGGLAFSY
ncbi:short-chain dehydrogenase/reductase SDR [Zopfochytrium polystomum]|nr:short-chain dehydrogenase/reductase SDR [Zopfochytrium polystomum]